MMLNTKQTYIVIIWLYLVFFSLNYFFGYELEYSPVMQTKEYKYFNINIENEIHGIFVDKHRDILIKHKKNNLDELLNDYLKS